MEQRLVQRLAQAQQFPLKPPDLVVAIQLVEMAAVAAARIPVRLPAVSWEA